MDGFIFNVCISRDGIESTANGFGLDEMEHLYRGRREVEKNEIKRKTRSMYQEKSGTSRMWTKISTELKLINP